jgi:L-Ala-D/L-Glu epimerase
MRITALNFLAVRLPFRFAFKHSLAERSFSHNIIARAVIESGGKTYVGIGEGVPRDYVTGETVEEGLYKLRTRYANYFVGKTIESKRELLEAIDRGFENAGLESSAGGAAWCALELAILDSFSKSTGTQLTEILGGAKRAFVEHGITYGGVIPFGGERTVRTLLWLYKLAGFQTVKLKVGRDFDTELKKIGLARKILGPAAKLRIDPNCAWNCEETIRFAELSRKYGLSSIEQPVPADDWQGLKEITDSIPEQVVADESLCTLLQAKNLAKDGICSGFNIRLSKVGGMLPALKIAEIAHRHGIACHLGAQVGESGILSAAGRTFAAISGPFENYEGSANAFLLKTDLTRENLTFGMRGVGRLLTAPGLGVTVLPERLQQVKEVRSDDPGKLKSPEANRQLNEV